MTTQEKQLLRKALIALWEILQSETKTEAIRHIDEFIEVADEIDELAED